MRLIRRSLTHGPSVGRHVPPEAGRGQADELPVAQAWSPKGAVPQFESLARDECEAVLARNHVGRLAYSFHDQIDIQPIHYVFADGWLYGRTSQGWKLATLRHSRWVAFEVDEIEAVFQWRSVVVRGAFHSLSPDGPMAEATAWEHGIDLLRRLVPETWTSTDPVAFRTAVFRIHVDAITGRAATMSSARER